MGGLSTEFRRKLLIGEVMGTSTNKAILAAYEVKDLPKVMVLKDGEPVWLEKKPTYNSLNFFLTKHALKKPSDGPVKKAEPAKEADKTEAEPAKEEDKTEKAEKTEL